ncbi:MAG: hypothetical protein ACYC55_05850 [Candidatus Geothermincolia bacterium]
MVTFVKVMFWMSILAVIGIGISLGIEIIRNGRHQKALFLAMLGVFLFTTTFALMLSFCNL